MTMMTADPVTFGMLALRPVSPILAGRKDCHFTVCPGHMPESLRGGKTTLLLHINLRRPKESSSISVYVSCRIGCPNECLNAVWNCSGLVVFQVNLIGIL